MVHKSVTKVAFGLLLSLLLCFSNIFGFDTSINHNKVKAETSTTYNPTELIFTLYNSTDLAGVASTYQLANINPVKLALSYVASVPTGQDSLRVAARLNRDSRVQMAEPDYYVSYLESGMSFKFDNNSTLNPGAATTTAKTQWAWSKTNLAVAQTSSAGSGVRVALLDTGVNYNLNQFNGKVTGGYNVFNGSDGLDVNGHGTFVAGLINQVAPQATILPVQVLDANGIGSMTGIINGVNYAIANGAKVINMSFSTPTYSQTLEKLIRSMAGRDIVMVAAAGNNNSSLQYYPAGFTSVLAVGGTDPDDNKSIFSNYGPYLGLGAPSTTIYSYWWKGGYAWGDGTSFAAPLASSAAALYRSLHPGVTALSTVNTLRVSADFYPSSCSICFRGGLGRGRLNFAQVVATHQ